MITWKRSWPDQWEGLPLDVVPDLPVGLVRELPADSGRFPGFTLPIEEVR